MHGRSGLAVVAVADIGVGVAHLAQHLADHVVQVLARAQQRQQPAVFVADRRPVLAVHHRREEQVPLEAPGVVEHLRPFPGGIDQHAHVPEIERLLGVVVLGGVGLGVEDGEVLVVLDQHPLAVQRQRVAVDVVGDDRVLALLQVVEVQRRFLALQRTVDQADGLGQIEDARRAGVDLGDVGRVDRQGDGAGHHAVEVDPDRRDGAGLVRRRLAVQPAGLVAFLLGVLALVVRRCVVGLGALVVVGHGSAVGLV